MNNITDLYRSTPQFVLGFHGCDKSVADDVIKYGKMLKSSTNDYDWLGSGIYFWENDYQRAREWAEAGARRKSSSINEPAVIGAVIDLGFCLDMLNRSSITTLQRYYTIFKTEIELTGKELPTNQSAGSFDTDRLLRRLDCAVIQGLHEFRKAENEQPFDSLRGVFTEAKPIYENSGFLSKTHIQLCIRNPNCIKGFFEPRDVDPNWSVPH